MKAGVHACMRKSEVRNTHLVSYAHGETVDVWVQVQRLMDTRSARLPASQSREKPVWARISIESSLHSLVVSKVQFCPPESQRASSVSNFTSTHTNFVHNPIKYPRSVVMFTYDTYMHVGRTMCANPSGAVSTERTNCTRLSIRF